MEKGFLQLVVAYSNTSIHSAGYVHKLFVKSVKERSELFGFLLGAKILQSPVAIISLCSQGHSTKASVVNTGPPVAMDVTHSHHSPTHPYYNHCIITVLST